MQELAQQDVAPSFPPNHIRPPFVMLISGTPPEAKRRYCMFSDPLIGHTQTPQQEYFAESENIYMHT